MRTTNTLKAYGLLVSLALSATVMLMPYNGAKAQTFHDIGTGTIILSNTSYPAPYGHYYKGAKHQFLITAAEIMATGATSGNLQSIGFNVASVNGTPLTGFTVKVGMTSLSSLTTWIPGLTTVYSVSSYTESIGWNMHDFVSNFAWDGISNLIIETCFDTYPTAYTRNAPVYQSATAFTSTLVYISDGGGVCPYTDYEDTYQQRPNIRLKFAPFMPLDIGVVSLDSPAVTFTPGIQNVAVKFRNFGTDTLTSCQIGWSINGVAQTPYSWSGSLPSIALSSSIQLGSYTFPSGSLAFKAYTYAPNNGTDAFPVNDTLRRTLYSCTSLSGTYTIGGSSPDFNNFAEAMDMLLNCGVSGPVIFKVAAGTYTEQLAIPPVPGASSTNTITFESANSDSSSVVLNWPSSTIAANNYLISFNGAQWIRFQYLTLQRSGTNNYARVISFQTDAHNITLLHNRIIGVVTVGSDNNYDRALIYSGWSTTDTNFTMKHNRLEYGCYGLVFLNNFFGDQATADSNLFISQGWGGIYVSWMDDLFIRGNYLQSHSSVTIYYGIYLEDIDGYSEVTGNVVVNASSNGYGIFIGYCNGNSANPSITANNFIHVNTTGSGTMGLYVYNSSYQEVSFNSVNITGSNTSSYAAMLSSSSNNISFKNNVLVNQASGFALRYESSLTNTSSNYNDLYTNGALLVSGSSANYADLNTWRSALGQDLNSISALPVFTSNSDLHTNSAILSNAGIALASITTDIDGEPRSSVPDIGADEFALTGLDASIALLTPTSPLSFGNTVVSVRVVNTASTTITSLNLSYADGSITQSQAFTGLSIAPMSYQDLSFTTLYNFNSFVQFRAYINSVNGSSDLEQLNDTTAWRGLCFYMSGSYTINPAVATGGTNFQSFGDALNAMLCGGVTGHVTFDVSSGTYNQQLRIPPIPGTSDTSTVTFQSAVGDSTAVSIVFAASASAENYTVWLDGADYVRFSKMTIIATNTSFGRALMISNGANYNQVSNCALLGPATTSTSTNLTVLYSPSTVDSYNKVNNCLIKYGSYGIYWAGSSSFSNDYRSEFVDNLIMDFYYMGMYISYVQDGLIEGNQIQNATNSSTTYGIYAHFLQSGCQLRSNKIILNGSSTHYGIFMHYPNGQSGSEILVSNNFVALTRATSVTQYGIYSNYATKTLYLFNNINLLSTNSGSRAIYITQGTDNHVVNNILCNQGSGYTYYRDGNGVSLSDYNDLFTNGTNIGYFNGSISSLANWRIATGMDMHSITANPGYISSSDLHVSSLALNGRGISRMEESEDIDGESRSMVPDIGADEFLPTGLDAAIFWVEPISPVAPGTHTIKVGIVNTMTTSITSVNLSYTNGTVIQTEAFSGLSIAPGSADTLSFAVPVSLSHSEYMRAYINQVNGASDNYNGNDTTNWEAICIPMAGQFTIDNTVPTSGTNFNTFNEAVFSLNCGGITDTVIFMVTPGTYTEQLQLTPVSGASDTSVIIFRSASADSTQVVLQFSANSTSNFVLRLNGADYFVFEGITIKALNTTYARCVELMNGADHNRFLRNQMISSEYTGSAAVPVFADGNNRYNSFHGNYIKDGYYGIYYNGTYPELTGVEFTNNVISNFVYYGFYLISLDSVIIRGNHLSSRSYSSDQYGMYLNSLIGGFVVDRNRVTMNSTYYSEGIRVYYCSAYLNERGVVSNNFLILPVANSNMGYGLRGYYSNYVDYYHNSIYISVNNNPGYPFAIDGGSNNNVLNNIFATEGNQYAYYVYNTGTSVLLSDYNDFYSNGTDLAYWNGPATNLAALSALSGKDTSSISVNPSFLSATDLHTFSVLLDNQGTPVSNVLYDIDGDPRDTLHPDIGADEFSAPHIELAMLSITSPSDGCGLGFEVVSVAIAQLGSDTLSSGVTLYYQSGSSTPVSQAVTSTIYPTDTVLISFTTPLNMSVTSDSIFQLRVWVNHIADPIHANDTAEVEVRSGYIPPPPTTIGATVPGGNSAMLIANGTGNKYWYSDTNALAFIFKGDTLTTPVLWDTTTYWAEARMGSASTRVTVGSGTGSSYYSPAYGWYNYSWSAIIYTAAEIAAAGQIDTIAFYLASSISNYYMYNQKVYFAHTSLSNFNSNTNKPNPGLMTKVYEGTVVWNGSGWFYLPLSSDFDFNGSDNLLIYWENFDGSYSSGYPSFQTSYTTNVMTIGNWSDGGFPTGSGSTIYDRPNVRLSIEANSCPSPRVPATANVIGSPTLVLDKSCIHFGSLMQYLSKEDSVQIKNTGTYLLKIQGLQLSDPVYSYAVGQLQLIPGDSMYINITALSNVPGIFLDTLRISTNAGSYNVCLSSLFFGAPVDSISPASFNVTLTACSDTVVLPLMIANPGLSDLTYTINGGTSGMVPASCTPVTTGYCCGMGIYNVTFANINNSSSDGSQSYQDFTSTPAAIVRPGQTYQLAVTTGTQYSEHVVAWIDYNNNGIFESLEQVMYVTNTYQYRTSNILIPSNSIVNVPLRMRVMSDYYGSSVPQPCNNVQYGQAEDYSVIIDGGIIVGNVSDTVSPGLFHSVPIYFTSTDLWNGTYYSQISITTNNPLHPATIIPCTLVVDGDANPVLSSACVDLDSVMQYTSRADTLWVYNAGCDMLYITNTTNQLTEFTHSVDDASVEPYDSTFIRVVFSPQALGILNDTLVITTNVGVQTVCLRGEGIVIPVIATSPTSYNVTINDCNDSLSLPLTVYNQGQGELIYYFASGYGTSFDSTSQIVYNYTGAQTIHTFSLPITWTDSIYLTVVQNGDYDYSTEYSTLYIDNQLIGVIIDNDLSNGTNITTNYSFGGAQVASWVADGIIQVKIVNSNQVDAFSGIGNYHRVKLVVPGTTWINISVAGDTVAPGDSSVVNVEFNAFGLRSGTYNSGVRIYSNDPLNPVLNIPSTLQVIGSPLISTPTTCIAFGNVVENAVVKDTFWIANLGCDTLSISSMSPPGSTYTLSGSSFNILPNDSQMLILTFAPLVTGNYDGNITINHNVGSSVLCVTANCVDAATLALSPTSAFHSLACWTEDSLSFKIKNVGLGTLNYLIRGGYGVSGAENTLIIRDALPFSFNLQGYLLTQFGVHATVISSTQISSTNFDLYDVIITSSDQSSAYYSIISSNQAKFESFASKGGVIVYLLANFAVSKVDLAGGIDLMSGSNEYYSAIVQPSHPLCQGLASTVYGSYANYGYLSSLTVGTEVLLKSNTGQLPVVVEYEYGRGKVLASAMPWELLHSQGYTSQTLLFRAMNYAQNLLTDGPAWLSFNSQTGSVNSGDSINAWAYIDATGMNTGLHQANIFVETNDPLQPVSRVPLDITVTGFALLTHNLSNCYDAQHILVGGSGTDSILISNTGCDSLHVSGLSFVGSSFSAYPSSMHLAPGGNAYLKIVFTPMALGQILDTVSISSNIAVVKICLTGYGDAPPLIGLNPTSVTKTILNCADSVTQNLTISNTGTGVLNFNIPGVYGSSFNPSSTQYFYYNGSTTSHNFSSIPSNLDSLFVTLTLNGDFDDAAEYATLYIDGSNLGIINDGNAANGTNIVVRYAFGGAQLAAWLSNNYITVQIQNASNVDVYSSLLNFHKVELSVHGVSWMTMSPVSGSIAAGNSTNVSLKFKAGSLMSNTYTNNLWIVSNDPLHPAEIVPCTLVVDGDPILQAVTSSQSFGTHMVGAFKIDSVAATNTGCDTARITLINSTLADFIPLISSLNILPGSTKYIPVKFAPLAVGARSATLTLTSDGGNVNITLGGIGAPAPLLSIVTSSLVDTLRCLMTDTLQLRIANNGQSNLTFSISNPAPWVTLAQMSGTIFPAGYIDIDMLISKQGLAIGNHIANIQISTNDPVNPSGVATVNLNVPNIIQPVNLGPDVSICGSNTYTINAGSGYASYMWSTGSPAQAILVSQTGTYYVDVVDNGGCTFSDTANITHYGMPVANAGSDTVACQGTALTLQGSIANGVAPVPNNALIGTWNSFSASGTITPFLTYYQDQRMLLQYRESELIAAGLSRGDIIDIAFNVGSASADTLHGFTVKMGLSNLNSLSGFIGGLNLAYSSNTFTLQNGWNTIQLSSPFYWNGLSNVLIEICWDNSSGNYSSSVEYSYAANSVWSRWADNASGCMLTGGSGGSYRPNLKLTIAQDQSIFSWSGPNGFASVLKNPTLPVLQNVNAGAYTLLANNGLGCTDWDTVIVSVSPTPAVNAGVDHYIYENDTVTISSIVTGGIAPFTYLWSPSDNLSSPTAEQTMAWPPTTTIYTLSVTGSNNCSSFDQVTVDVTPLWNISGQLAYQNQIQNPLSNTWVYLTTLAGTAVDSSYSNNAGAFSFIDELSGQYRLSATPTKAWGGVNSTDALLVQKHVIQMNPLTGLSLKAADVSGNGIVSSLDALRIMRRTVGLDTSFAAGNWVSQNDTIQISNSDRSRDVKALCYGDVNGSYTPSGAKEQPIAVLREGDVVIQEDGSLILPLAIRSNHDIGAITLFVTFELNGLEFMKLSTHDPSVLHNAEGIIHRFAWADPGGLKAGVAQVIAYLQVMPKAEIASVMPKVLSGTEIAGIDAVALDDAVIMLPRTGLEGFIPEQGYMSQNVPNPFNTSTHIAFGLPEDARIRLTVTDVIGREVRSLASGSFQAGHHSVDLEAGGLPAGIYTYTLEAYGPGQMIRISHQLVVTR